MGGRWWGRALAFLGLLVGVGVIAAFAYHAGTLNDASVGAMHAGGGPEGMMYGRGGGFGHGGGFFAGFFVLRILFGLFFLFLLLRIARFAIFGPRHRGGWGCGPMGPGSMHDRRRAMLEEWHRTAHAEGAVTPDAAPASAAVEEPKAPAEPLVPATGPDAAGEEPKAQP